MAAAPAETQHHIDHVARAAEAADGVAPLDEATLLDVRDGRADVVAASPDGFALWRGSELALVVHPQARERGVGGGLLADALASYDVTTAPRTPDEAAVAPAPVTAWSHGNHAGAAALAARSGFDRVRDLWVMRRPMSMLLPAASTGSDVRVRSYRDGDRDELLRVNAAAFASHPEQGAMDEDDLARRMAEPWFSAAGLLVAESRTEPGSLLGFHWTKQHSAALGEVYVVGVDPAAQGRGLGRLLTLAGLHHLTGLGVSEVLLYVESDNTPAVRTYAALGFTHAAADTHVMYRRA